jgi:cobalt transporter subunit CbtB
MNTQNQSLDQTLVAPVPGARIEVLRAALVAFLAGSALVYAMGFAHPSLLHNAAHDWRHGMNFPCH